MEHLPVFLNVKDRKVLVTGGGAVAARKAEMAMRAGARITVIADELGDDFLDIADSDAFTHQPGDFSADDLEGCVLAYGATGDKDKDARLKELAHAAGVMVNIADAPKLGDFVMPSVVDRSPLVISITSSGNSPILARIIKARLESIFPATYGRLTSFVGELRGHVMTRLDHAKERRRFWENMLEGPVADRLIAGDEEGARAMFDKELDAAEKSQASDRVGEVFLVGAGPGDPDLLTFRALRLMQRADVVLYDRLIGKDLLNLVRRDAERVYVGKMPKDHPVPQEEISQLLVRHAKEGKRVLRLKGGDPFVFGRGGEEIELLAAEGVPFQVVPGITAASGCAAYAGIPLTHRDHAQSCIFLTGHAKSGVTDMEWEVLLQPNQTVAIYMGLTTISELTDEFIKRGADPALPAAMVDNGTRPNQRVVTGTLETLADNVAAEGLKGPAIIIIGTVVTLRDKLAWFN